MPLADWIYIVVVVAIGLFGDLIILQVRREQRQRQEAEGRKEAPHDGATPR